MWKYLLVSCLLFVTAATQSHARVSSFKYNAEKGICENAKGKPGFKKANAKQLFKKYDKPSNTYAGVNAECVDFRGFDFHKHLGFGNRRLDGWNLKGANLEGVKLNFVHIVNAQLAGTNFKDMDWGYVQISGQMDKNTILPEGCEHDPKKDKVDCKK